MISRLIFPVFLTLFKAQDFVFLPILALRFAICNKDSLI